MFGLEVCSRSRTANAWRRVLLQREKCVSCKDQYGRVMHAPMWYHHTSYSDEPGPSCPTKTRTQCLDSATAPRTRMGLSHGIGPHNSGRRRTCSVVAAWIHSSGQRALPQHLRWVQQFARRVLVLRAASPARARRRPDHRIPSHCNNTPSTAPRAVSGAACGSLTVLDTTGPSPKPETPGLLRQKVGHPDPRYTIADSGAWKRSEARLGRRKLSLTPVRSWAPCSTSPSHNLAMDDQSAASSCTLPPPPRLLTTVQGPATRFLARW